MRLREKEERNRRRAMDKVEDRGLENPTNSR